MLLWLVCTMMVCMLAGRASAWQEKRETRAAEPIGWGKEKDGLQAGLFLKNPSAVFRYGDTIHFTIRIRNRSREPFSALVKAASQPDYRLGKGNRIQIDISSADAVPFDLEPNEEKTLPGGDCAFQIISPSEIPKQTLHFNDAVFPLFPGKHTLEMPFPVWLAYENDPSAAKGHQVKAGVMPFEIRDSVLPSSAVREKQARPRTESSLPAIQWGETLCGLQGGIHIGTAASNTPEAEFPLTLYVRNVSKIPLSIAHNQMTDHLLSPGISGEKLSGYGLRHRLPEQPVRSTERLLLPGEVFVAGKTALRLRVGEEPENARDHIPTLTAPPGRYFVSLTMRVYFTQAPSIKVKLDSAEVPFTLPLNR